MWRTRAVVTMLIEDIAGLRPLSNTEADTPTDQAGLPDLEPLTRGIRRARLVIAFDWIAILVLFLFRDPSAPFLPGDQTVDTVFTVGVLAIATHAGFRWAQLDRYRAVLRLCDDLLGREEV